MLYKCAISFSSYNYPINHAPLRSPLQGNINEIKKLIPNHLLNGRTRTYGNSYEKTKYVISVHICNKQKVEVHSSSYRLGYLHPPPLGKSSTESHSSITSISFLGYCVCAEFHLTQKKIYLFISF